VCSFHAGVGVYRVLLLFFVDSNCYMGTGDGATQGAVTEAEKIVA